MCQIPHNVRYHTDVFFVPLCNFRCDSGSPRIVLPVWRRTLVLNIFACPLNPFCCLISQCFRDGDGKLHLSQFSSCFVGRCRIRFVLTYDGICFILSRLRSCAYPSVCQ